MAQEVVKKPVTEKKPPGRIWLYILTAAVPAVLLALYYIYNGRRDIMDRINENVAAPFRNAMAAVTSFGPFKYFSLFEILATLLALWALIYIIRTIVILIARPQRLAHLARRLYVLAVTALYLFAAFSWLWGIGYHSTGFAEKSALRTDGVSVSQLTAVTSLFAEKAGELSSQVRRDESGRIVKDTAYYFALSKGLYTNVSGQFPALQGAAHTPKPMLYSKLMSRIGFTGVYVALTGEANINTDAPASLIPATIAHEMAHQRGVVSEDEANFAAIAACITSNIAAYEYSGYLSGLIYLTDALQKADSQAAARIVSTLDDSVLGDLAENTEYWSRYASPTADAVTAMYDGYLKSSGVELGVASYGACVDLLVAWLGQPAAA